MTRLPPSQEAPQPLSRPAKKTKVQQRAQQRFEPRSRLSYVPQVTASRADPLPEPIQQAVTVVLPVRRERKHELESLLAQMRRDPGHNRVLPFARLPRCHFGRLVLWDLEHDQGGRQLDPLLLLIADCDGPAERFLQDMIEVAGAGLDATLQTCAGYPSAPISAAERLDYLLRHQISTPAHYIQRPGRTVKQILDEAALRTAIEGFLDASNGDAPSATAMRQRILAFVDQNRELRWALQPPQRFGLRHRARACLDAAALPLALLGCGPLLVPALGALLVAIARREQDEPAPHIRPAPEQLAALTELEDHHAHNGFTAAAELKPGALRQLTLAGAQQLLGYGARHLFTRDARAGAVPLHFARVIPIEGGRRVVFATAHDGSLEACNDACIDVAWWALNLVFGNLHGSPRTRLLIFGGARREHEFKDYLRRHQLPTTVWYSAYRGLTVAQIETNAAIRRGLRGRMNEREAQAWLRLL